MGGQGPCRCFGSKKDRSRDSHSVEAGGCLDGMGIGWLDRADGDNVFPRDTSFNSTYLTEEKIGAEEKASINQNQQLIGSSCGDIHNITFPFQLQSDTQICGGVNNNFTLSCDNNRTILSLSSAKYYVHSINYDNSTIRLIDIGIQTNNNNNTNVCSSFPNHSLTPSNLTSGDPYTSTGISLLVFLNCENPVKSPYYINTTSYCDNGIDSSSLKGFSYVVAGQVSVWYVADSCTVQTIAVSSSPLLIGTEIASNFSLSDVNKALEYGFEVSWEFKTCKGCKKRASCFGDAVNVVAACSSVCSFQPSFLSKLWSFISSEYSFFDF
ncbi:hypothetical protein HYC85_000189 [Camellia sinensis]|uniref:Wall-associated receptor kinase galacturonan-binding domain-containing protein n=1 Tax=Camellia sinensis TaxID=4442 RepID=A0A7J7I1P9_CAMSI|nr:hypothetical protein HYC85_000189 [Camellia sinensis]